jgi:hypothetical protein
MSSPLSACERTKLPRGHRACKASHFRSQPGFVPSPNPKSTHRKRSVGPLGTRVPHRPHCGRAHSRSCTIRRRRPWDLKKNSFPSLPAPAHGTSLICKTTVRHAAASTLQSCITTEFNANCHNFVLMIKQLWQPRIGQLVRLSKLPPLAAACRWIPPARMIAS